MDHLSDRDSVFGAEFCEDYGRALPGLAGDEQDDSDGLSYLNAATCPDCGGGMVRLGNCCSCPSCGYQSCSV
jgi:hypothetical protein